MCNFTYNKGFYKEIGEKCLNYYKFNTIPFYNEIDHWDFYDFLENSFELKTNNYFGEINLYSLTYQGINSTLIQKNSKIKKYKTKMNNLIPLSIVKNVFSSFNIIYFVYFSGILVNNETDKIYFYLSLIFIGLLILSFYNIYKLSKS